MVGQQCAECCYDGEDCTVYGYMGGNKYGGRICKLVGMRHTDLGKTYRQVVATRVNSNLNSNHQWHIW